MARNGRRKSGATKTSQNTSGPSGSKAPATDQRSSAPSQSPRKSPPPHSTAEPSPARRVPSQSHPRKSSLSSGIADPMMCPGSTSSRPASHPVSPAQASPISIPADAGQAAEAKKEQGNVQFKLKNYSEAVTLYSEAIESDSTNPAYLANRAAALMSLRRYAPALADMQLALSERFIGPDTPPSSKNLVRLARCYFALGQFFQARQTLSKLLQQYPNLPEGKKEEARLTKLESTLETIKRNRDRKEWTMVLIGLDTLQRELDSGGLTAKEWLAWKVEALCGKKRWEDARCLSNDLVRSHPSDPEALYCRALVMYAQGNLTATVSHCQEAMRCDPDFTKARTLLRQSRNIEAAKEAGNVAFKASDFRTAIEKYLEARTIDPLNESITLTLDSNRAQALLKSDQTSEAVEVCEKILKIDSKHFKALRTRAKAKKAESDFDGAIADFQTAARNAPSDKERSEINAEIKSTKVLLAKSKYVDHYKILGVPRDASDDEIKKAFRKKSLIHHPDKGGNEEKFKEVNESYTILQDPQSRRRYDMIDPEHPSGSNDHCRGFGGDDDMEMPINMADLFQAGFAQRGGFRTSTTGGGAAGSRYGYSQFQSPFFSYPE